MSDETPVSAEMAIKRSSLVSIGLAITILGASVWATALAVATADSVDFRLQRIEEKLDALNSSILKRSWAKRLGDLNPDLKMPDFD